MDEAVILYKIETLQRCLDRIRDKTPGLVLTSAIITVGIAHPTRELRITWWKYVFFVGWAVPTFAQ